MMAQTLAGWQTMLVACYDLWPVNERRCPELKTTIQTWFRQRGADTAKDNTIESAKHTVCNQTSIIVVLDVI